MPRYCDRLGNVRGLLPGVVGEPSREIDRARREVAELERELGAARRRLRYLEQGTHPSGPTDPFQGSRMVDTFLGQVGRGHRVDVMTKHGGADR